MKTITLEEPGRFSCSETAPPQELAPGEALVSVKRVGICGTDLHAYRGKQPFFSYPRILGHELGVEVLEVRPGEGGAGDGDAGDGGIGVGDLCAVEPYLNCGECLPCRLGKSNCCERLQVLGVHTDGGMRERITVPVHKLHKSTKLSLEQLALVETLGIGAHAVARGAIQAGENVLVIGAGPIGLSVVQFAKIAGARVILLEASEQRMDFCRQQFGVDDCVHVKNQPVERLREILDGDLPIAVFDATGNPNSMMSAFQYVSSGGRLVLVGIFVGDVTFHDPEFHRREITLLATRNSVPADFTRILRLMEQGRVDTQPWITHRASYSTLVGDFPGWLEPDSGVVKAVLEL